MGAGEQQQAEGDSEQGGEDEPAGREQVNLIPVLQNDDGGDGDGYEDSERGSHVHRDEEGEERDRNEGFAETERGSDQRSEEDDGKDEDGG
jgi:hypothetical protein